MRIPRRLFYSACLLLILPFSVANTSVQADVDPATLTTIESRKRALTELMSDRVRLETSGDQVALIPLLLRIGEVQLKLHDLDGALTSANEAHALVTKFSGSENETLLVDSLTFSARVQILRTDYDTALALLQQSLALSQKLKYRAGEAESYTQMGMAYHGNYEAGAAEASNNKALEIWHELNNKRAEAQTLVNQGETYMIDDQVEQSIEALQKAEAIWRELNDPISLAATLLDLTFHAMRQGQWQTSRKFLNEAQTLLTDKEAEPYLAGKVAMGYGVVYEAYAQLDTALEYYRESFTYYRDGANDKSAAVDAGTKLGRVQALRGDYAAAEKQIEESLTLAQEIKSDLLVGLCHEDLGRVWLAAGSFEQARSEFLSALENFAKGGKKQPWARAQSYLGHTEFLLGNMDSAAAAYQSALSVFQKVTDYPNEAAVRSGLGKIALREGRLDQAELQLDRAIHLTEQLRENASNKDMRGSFLDSVHDRYEAYVELLMARHTRTKDPQWEIKAFEASESGRARALLDALQNNKRELREAADPLLLVTEEKLQIKEQQLIDKLTTMTSKNSPESEKAQVEKELADVQARSETVQASLNSNQRYNDLMRPRLDYETIKDQLTDADTSLLEYSLGSRNSFAWLITRNGLKTFQLPDKETINAAANQLLRLLDKPAISREDENKLQVAVDELSHMILEPLSDKLSTARLIVVADGTLQYVPFQMLKASAAATEPLVAKREIVDAPSASALLAVRRERSNRQPGPKTLVGFGDAVFSPDYLPGGGATGITASRSDQNFNSRQLPRLFNAKRELRAIGDVVGSEAAFYEEYDATRANLLQLDLSQFRILHVVTHGVLDDDHPELSGLFLSLVDARGRPLNGFVALADVYRMRAPVDLVVLSACRTALGKNLRGEGLVGLTRGFMYAGASSVLASLWKVDDAATAELMKDFYRHLLQDGMTPPAALRAAQNQLRSQPQWRSPYYWAGFTLQGDYDVRIKTPPATSSRRILKLFGGAVLSLLLVAIAAWYLRRRSYSISNR